MCTAEIGFEPYLDYLKSKEKLNLLAMTIGI